MMSRKPGFKSTRRCCLGLSALRPSGFDDIAASVGLRRRRANKPIKPRQQEGVTEEPNAHTGDVELSFHEKQAGEPVSSPRSA